MWWKRNLPPLNPLWINSFVKCHCVHYGCYNTLVQIEWRKSTEMHSLAVLETRRLKPRCWKGYTPLEVLREDQFLFLPASCGSKCSLTCGHCCCSVTKSFLTLWGPMCCSTPGFPVLYIPEFAQTHVYWVSNTIQLFHPLSPLVLLPFIFSTLRVLSNGLAFCIRWQKYWNFSFSIILTCGCITLTSASNMCNSLKNSQHCI